MKARADDLGIEITLQESACLVHSDCKDRYACRRNCRKYRCQTAFSKRHKVIKAGARGRVPDNNGGDKVSTQTKAKTIHRYRETEQYKKLASLLEGYSQHTIDNLYMSLAGNSLSRELLEDRLDALNLDPKVESQVFAIFRESA